MPRRYYYRRRSIGSRDKYSIEQAAGSLSITNHNGAAVIVPSIAMQGMRKVKHITISFATQGTGSSGIFYWAIVYVPGGTTPSALSVTGETLYEPNQFVMNAGVWDSDAGPNRISTPLARNLNSGDAVYLIVYNPSSNDVSLPYVARYAITLQ